MRLLSISIQPAKGLRKAFKKGCLSLTGPDGDSQANVSPESSYVEVSSVETVEDDAQTPVPRRRFSALSETPALDSAARKYIPSRVEEIR